MSGDHIVLISLIVDILGGLQDFVNSSTTLTFAPNTLSDDIEFHVQFNDDNITEADEGFFLVLEVVSSLENPTGVEVTRRMSLAAIGNDDSKQLELSQIGQNLSFLLKETYSIEATSCKSPSTQGNSALCTFIHIFLASFSPMQC